ncbi:MAG: ATP-binding cassette domain-containing protein [Bacteroidales bacterium]|nr:ATP-binding cassette domain-containing protein [Bacteroidales bacterium]
MKDTTTLVCFKNAQISNGDSLVISDFDFSISEGEFVYLTGRVGTGKTSIVRSIIGENPITGDEATVMNYNLLKLKNRQIPYLRREIGVVFQDFQLLFDRTIEDNLRFVLEATGWKSKSAINKRINEVLEMVGLKSKAHKMPHHLSGGEQQRIAIARALLNEPSLIIADEPTGNLDNETTNTIMDILVKINKEQGAAIIIVTHNQQLLEQYPGRVFVCKENECKEIRA